MSERLVTGLRDAYELYRVGNASGLIATAIDFRTLLSDHPCIWPPKVFDDILVFTSRSPGLSEHHIVFHCVGNKLESVNICCPPMPVDNSSIVMEIVTGYRQTLR